MTNPSTALTQEKCLAGLRRAEDTWRRRDEDAILGRFADDCVVQYAHLPEIRGKEAFTAFLKARLDRMEDYDLHKTLLAFTDNQVINSFVGSWTDTETGNPVTIYAIEVTEYNEEGKIARWHSAASPRPGVGQPPLPLVSSSYQP